MSYEAGQRIRFKRTIIDPADGDHTEFLMASGGELGTVVRLLPGSEFPVLVKADGWTDSAFGVKESEIEPERKER